MPKVIAQHTFTAADQARFAQISGDRNPMHMDAAYARRTQAGAPVVHGIHAVLWALEKVAKEVEIHGLKVRFAKFIHLDKPVTLEQTSADGSFQKLSIVVDGQAAVLITARSSPGPALDIGPQPSFPAPECLTVARHMQFEDLTSLENALPLRDLGGCFPNLSNALGVDRVRSIVQLSTLVGMACPGLHSIFSEFNVSLAKEEATALQWRVTRTDDRFRMIWMNVWGAIEGEVIAFARLAPVEPPDSEVLRPLIDPSEFNGRRALVVGGSRGLGAVTAKLLAAGGAEVVLTYTRGAEEAERLATEINGEVLKLDVTRLCRTGLPEGITHLYYYATPKIFRQGTATFSSSVFSEFCTFYIVAFNDLIRGLHATSPSLRSIFYPSTSALDDRPHGITEYAMAKAAAEELCNDLVTKDLAISMPRLPRIETDQTATVPPVPSADAVHVLLPLLRAEVA